MQAANSPGACATPAHGYACRFCGARLRHTFVDLGTSPLCQRHVTPARFDHAESIYPLHVYVCDACFLVQLPAYVAREEIFDAEYGYFSGFSDTWLRHAEAYVQMMTPRFGLGSGSRVVEIASNDGYLLQYFKRAGVPVLGIEPTENTAEIAIAKGIPSLVEFFGRDCAARVRESHGPANLILGNNVLAHVPDINDFVGGIKTLLAPEGIVTMEFPQLLHLIGRNYWDTIYHEHFSYLSFTTVEKVFEHHGMTMFDVDDISTHGGSIRIYACHGGDASKAINPRVAAMREREQRAGHFDLGYYRDFGERVKESKRAILEFLIAAKRRGKQIAAYGAPGKGNTLLNYCGIRTDLIDYTVDRSPHKQGNFLPGTRIPIHAPDRIRETRPDYLFLLPWNLKDEIIDQMSIIRSWGGKFVVPIPTVQVIA
ncbi:MAG: class I SAM-dependent methyltransferase [Burkholderiaceae bacterium]|nr:class I SAM-dependent methyltransferase [Burkholderiaceae bacterium]